MVITSLGTAEGQILPENAAALVGAGVLSVLLFPMLGLRRLQADAMAPGPGGTDGAAGDRGPARGRTRGGGGEGADGTPGDWRDDEACDPGPAPTRHRAD